MADYVRRGRRVADQAGRRVLAPVVAVRRQKTDLVKARSQLDEARRKLASTREELSQVKQQLRAARVERDTRRASDSVEDVIQRVRADHLTFLTPPALRDLALAAQDLEANHLTGLVIEAGTALGGSAIVLAAAKSHDRPMKVYDVFGMIPEPGERDGDDVHERYRTITSGEAKGLAGDTYYGYHDNLYDEVTESFVRLGVAPAEHQVELVRGLFQDTLTVDEPVALAHLDGDWYESTMTCLERISPLLVSGGRIVLDDYATWSGCRAAVDDYFRDRHMDFRFEQHNRLHVVRR
jgi:predicted O-methyltransferase YrrM